MSIGEKIFKYRKDKHITQEELADKLNVTRQTISKWETEESLPDLDKIAPLCELLGISADELLTDKKVITEPKKEEGNNKLRALIISISVTIYLLSIIWVIFASEVLKISDGVLVSVFLLLCTIATVILVYHFTLHSKKKEEEKKKEKTKDDSIQDNIIGIIAILFTIAYFVVSYITMAWHLTWMLWLVFAIVKMIVEIIFQMVGEKNGK